nr:Translin-associated factor X-interacting protein 1 [Polyrhizophydium stewartii]
MERIRDRVNNVSKAFVFREAFEHFISQFKTYQPVLSEIKNEYEPLKGKLSVIKFQAAQELDKVRDEALVAMRAVSNENAALMREIESHQKEIAAHEKKYQLLVDEMRRREIQEYTRETPEQAELRQLSIEYANYEHATKEKLAQKDYEISELEINNKRAKQELADVYSEIAMLKKSIAKSVSVLEHERVKQQLDKALIDMRKLEDEALQAAQARGKLEQKIKDVEAQLKHSQEERFPDWEYIQSGFGSSIREFWNLAKGLDYNETIATLIRELVKARSAAPVAKTEAPTESAALIPSKQRDEDLEVQYFVGQGLGSNVPKFLRFKGKVINRRLTKRNCLQLIRDTWEAKAVFDASPKNHGKRTKLADFLFLYLKKRFGAQEIIAEWGYNIMDACKRHGFQSPDCQLFYDILNDGVEEEVYHRVQLCIERLKNVFYRLDLHIHDGKARGFVPRAELMIALKKFWPSKSDQQREMLENDCLSRRENLTIDAQALDSDQPGSSITYRWLFESEGESIFLDVVREQEIEQRTQYIQGLQKLFDAFSKDPSLTVSDAAKILAQFDPDKRKADLDEYLARGFDQPAELLKPKTMIAKDQFLKNLRRNVLVFGIDSHALLEREHAAANQDTSPQSEQ